MYIWFLGWSGHGAFCSAQMVLKPIWTKSGAKTLVSKYLYYVLNQGISKVYRIFPCCNALIFMYSHLNGYLFHLQWNEFIFERSWMSNFTMGTILGKGFAQAQVHTNHSTSAEGTSAVMYARVLVQNPFPRLSPWRSCIL